MPSATRSPRWRPTARRLLAGPTGRAAALQAPVELGWGEIGALLVMAGFAAAAVRWTRLAGDVSVEWALAHHDDIEATARLRRQLRSLGNVSSTAPEIDEETADVAHAVVAHLTRLRNVGTGGESFPLILDDPFVDIPSSTRLSLLELLARSSGSPQVILLTDQEDVASWARLEALTGEVALVEPHAEPRESQHRSDLAV